MHKEVTYIGITGHQRISSDVESFITGRITDIVKNYKNFIGLRSLAAGTDQIFAELVLKNGGQLHTIIPAEDYRETFQSVSIQSEYDYLISKSKKIIRLPYKKSTEEAFLAAGVEILNRCDRIIAVWDGLPARGKGGTADIVKIARAKDIEMTIIWPK